MTRTRLSSKPHFPNKSSRVLHLASESKLNSPKKLNLEVPDNFLNYEIAHEAVLSILARFGSGPGVWTAVWHKDVVGLRKVWVFLGVGRQDSTHGSHRRPPIGTHTETFPLVAFRATALVVTNPSACKKRIKFFLVKNTKLCSNWFALYSLSQGAAKGEIQRRKISAKVAITGCFKGR